MHGHSAFIQWLTRSDGVLGLSDRAVVRSLAMLMRMYRSWRPPRHAGWFCLKYRFERLRLTLPRKL